MMASLRLRFTAIFLSNCHGNMRLTTRKTCLFENAQQMKVLVS